MALQAVFIMAASLHLLSVFICQYRKTVQYITLIAKRLKRLQTVANGCIMHFIHETAKEISRNEMWEILKKGG